MSRLARLIVVLSLACTAVVLAPTQAQAQSIPFACDHAPNLDGIPCSEIDRAVAEAANEFGIDHRTFRVVIECESSYEPVTGGYYEGLTQQSAEFFNRWFPRFNAAVNPDLGDRRPYASRTHPFDNARLAAYVIHLNGYAEWGRCAH